MTQDQIAIVALLAATLALFVWNRIRFDLVAVGALLAAVLLGLVEADDAFSGFGNPAVVTVAAVLVIGRALALSGAVDRMVAALAPRRRRPLRPDGGAVQLRRPDLGLHEQCRGAGAGAAGGDPGRAQRRLFALGDPDAAVLRHAAGRHHHPDRHAAEPADLRLPREGGGRAVPPVRLRPGRPGADRRRPGLHAADRLAADPVQPPRPQGGGGELRDQPLRHRGRGHAEVEDGRALGDGLRGGAEGPDRRARHRPRQAPGRRADQAGASGRPATC